jgi:hypothetical protein
MRKIKLIKFIIILTICFTFLLSAQSKQRQKTTEISTQKPQIAKLLPDLTVSFTSRTRLPIQFKRTKMKRDLRVTVKNIGKKEAKNFFVDYFLSTDRKLSVNQIVYSPVFREDVLLKGGRFHIPILAPGASKTFNYTPPFKIDRLPAKRKYYIGVFVDSQRTVKEWNEGNNFDWQDYFYFPAHIAHINSIGQLGIMSPASLGQMTLELHGTGFGNDLSNKTVQMGPYTLNLQPLESAPPTHVQAVIPQNVVFGVEYNVYYAKDGIRISNIKKHLLKVWFEGIMLSSDYNVYSGPPGCVIGIHGAYFGSTQGSFVVKFGTTTATVSSWSNNQVNIICPNVPPGNYNIHFEKGGQNVTLNGGGWTVTSN